MADQSIDRKNDDDDAQMLANGRIVGGAGRSLMRFCHISRAMLADLRLSVVSSNEI